MIYLRDGIITNFKIHSQILILGEVYVSLRLIKSKFSIDHET